MYYFSIFAVISPTAGELEQRCTVRVQEVLTFWQLGDVQVSFIKKNLDLNLLYLGS